MVGILNRLTGAKHKPIASFLLFGLKNQTEAATKNELGFLRICWKMFNIAYQQVIKVDIPFNADQITLACARRIQKKISAAGAEQTETARRRSATNTIIAKNRTKAETFALWPFAEIREGSLKPIQYTIEFERWLNELHIPLDQDLERTQ